jgi:hypothetical protein
VWQREVLIKFAGLNFYSEFIKELNNSRMRGT